MYIFFEKLLKLVIKQSCISHMRCIGSTEGSILVSHIYFDVCSSLTLMHERHANMDDLVKLRKKVLEIIFNIKAVVIIFLCLRRNYKPLSMHSTHGAFSRGIKFRQRQRQKFLLLCLDLNHPSLLHNPLKVTLL